MYTVTTTGGHREYVWVRERDKHEHVANRIDWVCVCECVKKMLGGFHLYWNAPPPRAIDRVREDDDDRRFVHVV